MKLLASLQHSQAWLHGDRIWAAAEAHLATPEAFQVLAGRLNDLERLAGPRIAQQTPSRKSPRGRYWASPQRQPASGDVLTLDTLVLALQGIGFTARIAKQAVKAILAAIIAWLQDGGFAETPLGVFEIVHRPKECTRFQSGRALKFNTKPRRVAFRPSPELRDACNRSQAVPSKP